MVKYISITILLSILLLGERLDINISSKQIYESEPLIVELSFESDINNSAIRLESRGFEAKDFEVKKIDSNITQIKKGAYSYRSLWLLKPKKIGKLTIPPQRVVIYRLNKSSYLTMPKEYKSPSVDINVKRLPKDTLLAGNLIMSATLNKRQIEANKPITLTLTIQGEGDLTLIPPFNPKIEDAISFPSSPKISQKIDGNRYIGKWIQKIGYSSNRDFTIPSFQIKYINSSTNTLEILKSEPIDISVNSKADIKRWLIYLSLIIFGAFIAILVSKIYNRSKQKESDIIKELKRAKRDEDIYKLLLPYSNNKNISIWIEKLEDNIYSNKSHKIDKREIILSLEKL